MNENVNMPVTSNRLQEVMQRHSLTLKMPNTIVAVIGMAGSGKSTLCRRIYDQLNIKHVVTGDIARELSQTDPEVKSALDRGEFAPRDKMNRHFARYIETNIKKESLLLDGYPRYRDQLFDLYIAAQLTQSHVVLVHVECDPKVARRRLLERRRHDDKDQLINKRLELFIEETYPLLGLFPIVFRGCPIWTIRQGSEVEMLYQVLDKIRGVA